MMYGTSFTRLILGVWLAVLPILGNVSAEEPQYVVATIDGQRMRIRDDRQPALYTADYGDCLGESAINVTRFDAAYYRDNMTIIFHLAGETALMKEDIMMSIGVYAYGESRFDLTFNPCDANIESACPVKAGTPIEAAGIIPINEDDVAGIPELAISIPDFEGQAILRLFSNSTQAEIGCFAAQITNGYTFQQNTAVGWILGFFTLVAIISSFVTATYGDKITVIRKHYAHSLSVMIVFAVWHHIFYSGALSLNWPSVLVAFWSNYAWAGGIIYSESMQNVINDFIGSNKGNTSQVGAAGTGVANPGLGGGYDIQQIYRRSNFTGISRTRDALLKRHLVDAKNGFTYYGEPVNPGLPLPGNYSGFAGTLALKRIPASNAFMTGLLWFLILATGITIFMVLLKLVLEGLYRSRVIQEENLALYRRHYRVFTAATLLRTLLISFFVLVFLTMFQVSYLVSPGPVALACVVFVGMVFGLGSTAAYAWYSRITFGHYLFERNDVHVERVKLLGYLPWFTLTQGNNTPRSEDKTSFVTIRWWAIHPKIDTISVHEDENFTLKFGWLVSRYRKTRWWFFVVWLMYEFVRACFLAGASNRPMVQVFGLLAVELIAFVTMIVVRPFEGQRLNILMVYLLGISKVTTVALSAAFDTRFEVPRIPATVIGIVIIIIQGLLTIAIFAAITIGAMSSYMSIMRDQEDIRPRRWNPRRVKYFERIDAEAQDLPRPRKSFTRKAPEVPKNPYFSVRQVKRLAKVEDEDDEFMQEIQIDMADSRRSTTLPESPFQRPRAASLHSQRSLSNLPPAARLHRTNWSMRDYAASQWSERRGAMSTSTATTPILPRQLPSRAVPPINSSLGTYELTKALIVNDSGTKFLRVDATNIASPATQASSRLKSRSRSSSKPNVETIEEESIPPLPEQSSMTTAESKLIPDDIFKQQLSIILTKC